MNYILNSNNWPENGAILSRILRGVGLFRFALKSSKLCFAFANNVASIVVSWGSRLCYNDLAFLFIGVYVFSYSFVGIGVSGVVEEERVVFVRCYPQG